MSLQRFVCVTVLSILVFLSLSLDKHAPHIGNANTFVSIYFRLLDDYLVLFKKEISERKNWISVNENRMSSSYMDIESFEGFQEELKDHKVNKTKQNKTQNKTSNFIDEVF